MMMNLCPARGGGRCLALALFLLIVPHASADLIKFTIGANANEVAAGDGTIRAGTGGLSRVITVTQGEPPARWPFACGRPSAATSWETWSASMRVRAA
jgi:hypothetical protein